MQVPPVQFDISTDKVETPLPRMPWVWVGFTLLFAFIIFTSLATSDKRSLVKDNKNESQERAIDMAMCLKSLTNKQNADHPPQLFKDQVDQLLEPSRKEARAQKLRIVLRTEDGAVPFRDDITNLAKSAKPEDQAFAKLYTEPKPKKEEALKLLKQVDGNEISERIAAVQVKESFGDKDVRSKTFDPTKVIGFSIVGLCAVLGLGIGVVLWYIYGFQRAQGKLTPKGMPLANIDLGRADRLGFVALVVISTYYLSGEFFGWLSRRTSFGIDLFVYLPVFVAVAVCLNVPIFGWRITPKTIGISFEKFPEKIGWALAGFFANVPILLIFIGITAALQKVLPGGGHPVSEELMNNPSSGELLKIAFLACVMAPIWEEIFFRGLLFPAFTKFFGKPIYGALLSSFIFASIHPQGLLGVPVLMAVALMLCAVSYQTKSLVANIILHGLHNGATLIAALLLAPLLK